MNNQEFKESLSGFFRSGVSKNSEEDRAKDDKYQSQKENYVKFHDELTSRFFAECDVEEQEDDHKKCKGNQNIEIYLCEFTHLFPLSSSQKAISKHTIAAIMSKIKIILSWKVDRLEKFGKIKIAPIQPAVKFVKSPESTFTLVGLNSFAILNNCNKLGILYEQ